jgi:hypothetical protein
MCFANDIYLIIKKSKNRFVSLVLVGFWYLLRYYGFIISNIFLKVKALKYCITEQNDVVHINLYKNVQNTTKCTYLF